jgi:hypothetical protein
MRFLISAHNPESPRWRASLIHDINSVENYLLLIGEESHAGKFTQGMRQRFLL